jgi:two-component sensor histidine kinase
MPADSTNNLQALTLPEAGFSTASPVERRRPRTISVRSLLLLAVFLIVVPGWSFAGYVAWRYALAEQQRVESSSRFTARAVASAVEFRLTAVEAALQSLALSPALQAGDIRSFYREASAMALTQRAIVALTTPAAVPIFNTSAPFGTALPAIRDRAIYTSAVETGKTQVSKAFLGNVTNRWLVSIAIPVRHGDDIPYVLVMALDVLVHFGEIFDGADVPSSWTLALLDQDNVVIARRPMADNFVGKPAHPDITKIATEAESGSGLGTTLTNEPVQVFYQRLKRAPWLMLIGVPRADLEGALAESVTPVIIIGLLILLASLVTAWLMGRRFTRQLTSIARTASDMRVGRQPAGTVSTRITELSELKQTLDSAAEERNRYEERLKGLIADKDLLILEVHHRVKNSLQLVRGILSLQARSTTHPEAKAELNAAAARIVTVADVHQHLYQGHSTAEIHVGRYLADLASDLGNSMITKDSNRTIVVDAPDAIWPSEKVTTLGLIVTELVTNAVKYSDGDVMVRLSLFENGSGTLVVEDQGPGFGDGFELGKGMGLGSKLVTSLLRPEDGSIKVDRSVNFGRIVLQFNRNWRSDRKE